MSILGEIKKRLFARSGKFDYKRYWEDRYRREGNSGTGSYGVLAEYKAEVINRQLKLWHVSDVLEFGCGDGNQLGLIDYPKYLGLDVSLTAVETCRTRFGKNPLRRFEAYDPEKTLPEHIQPADLVVCLDVLYHITSEPEFKKTLDDIFRLAGRYVILYTNTGLINAPDTEHVVWRDTMKYLKEYPEFTVTEVLEQPYKDLSCAGFIMMEKSPALAG